VNATWLTRRQLNGALNRVFPFSIHCYAFQFGTDAARWSACCATHGGDAITAWTSAETYDTQLEAVCAAYRHAWQAIRPEPPFDFSTN